MKTREISVLRAIGISLALATLVILVATAVRGAAPLRPPPFQGISIPTDAKSDCKITSSQFAGWFQDHRAKTNGFVDPADSVAFPATSTSPCPFYTWAHRMFLWITSPAPSYARGARNFDTGQFFDVSPPDSHGDMTLIAHVPGRFHFFQVRASKPDAQGLQIIRSANGQLLEVQRNQKGPHKLPLVATTAGTQVEVQRVAAGPGGHAVFYDVNGKVIAGSQMIPATPRPRPGPAALARGVTSFPGAISTPIPVQKFIVKAGVPIYVDGSGNVVPVASGETDASVLESQGGSLVYYAIMVNDVYAYFLTGQRTEGFLQTQFPTTKAEEDAVTQFAAKHHVKIADPGALAVEVKTAWVDATTLSDPGDYITTTASIPTFNTSDPANWQQNGTKTATLAMVGMHIVGSVAGHPDMVWSTFENVRNAPDASYSYTSTRGVKTVAQSTKGAWVFCCSNAAGPFNQARMSQVGTHIESNRGFTIGPSDTIRWKPWGAASNQNAGLRSPADSNAEVIAMNHDEISMLPDDVRSDYVLIGATWTGGSGGPIGDYPHGNVFGTNDVANTTLETYLQGSNVTNAGSSTCFLCHNATSANLLAMSHIFFSIKPLFGKALITTPESMTLKPSHYLAKVPWKVSTIICNGVSPGANAYFQAVDQNIYKDYTSLFPEILKETYLSGAAAEKRILSGSSTAVLYWSSQMEDQLPQPCANLTNSYEIIGLNEPGNSEAPAGAVAAELDAQSGIYFDLHRVYGHTILSATLNVTPTKTLHVWNAMVPQQSSCDITGRVQFGPYSNVECNVKGVVGAGAPSWGVWTSGTLNTSGGGSSGYGGSSSGSSAAYITYPVDKGEASLSSGGWCWLDVWRANRSWLSGNIDDITYSKPDLIVRVLGAPTSGGPGPTGYSSGAPAFATGPSGGLNVNVTKYVQDWAAHNGAGNDGFVLSNPSAGIMSYPSNGCIAEYNASLSVVYFK
jgi:hypothetical protein